LVDAQQARRVLDRLVGYKLSPLLWKKITRGLSAGRVQSVALKMIADREKEIEKFKPQEYWSIEAFLSCKNGDLSALLKEKNGKKIDKLGVKTSSEAEEIKNDLSKASFVVEKIEKKEKKRNPLPPFTTSTMQQEAFKRLRFPSGFTMRIAQSLYEKGLITYHRTDSLHVSKEARSAGEKYIKESLGEKYYEGRVFASKGKTQEAHEAVRPSTPELSVEKTKGLKDEEKKLYDLIWRRFVASLMTPAVFYSTSLEVKAEGEESYLLSATGSIMKFEGFSKIYKIKFEENELPETTKGEKLDLKEIKPEQHFTKPPSRFSEASLIKELEKHGIGRPSTYAPTLSTLAQRNYTQKVDKRYLKPTEVGMIVNDLLSEHFPFIVDFKFTAKMEEDLDEIAEGNKEWKTLIKDFYKDFAKTLEKKEEEIKKENIMNEKTDEKCDKCGGEMEVKFGKFGKFIACKNFPDCKTTKPYEKSEEEKDKPEEIECDKCGSKMQIKQSRFGKFYGCSNYPQCKNIKSLEGDLGIKCPDCNEGNVVKKRSKKGNTFYACDQYPKCEFTSSKKPE